MNRPLDKYITEKGLYWPLWMSESTFSHADNGMPENEKRLIDFIATKLSFGYDSPYNDYFNPAIQLGGKRSFIFGDLTEEDFGNIKRVIANTTNIFLLAKCYDLLFIHTSEKSYCAEAVKNHLLIADGFLEKDQAFGALEFIERALYLLKRISDHTTISDVIDKLVFRNTYSDPNTIEQILNAIFGFFKTCSYTKYGKKNLVLLASSLPITDSHDGLELLKNIIDHYSSIHDLASQNGWINRYADTCEKLCEKNTPHGYRYIQLAIEALSKQADLNAKRINELRFRLEDEQQKFFNSIHFQRVPIDQTTNGSITEYIQSKVNELKDETDSLRQLGHFLRAFEIVREKELEGYNKKKNESVFNEFVNQVIFDENMQIVNEFGPDDKEKRTKQSIAEALGIYHAIYGPIAAGYARFVIIDSQLIALFSEIISHNELVPKERAKEVSRCIMDGLSKDIKGALFLLIPQFEYGCFSYLKCKKRVYPVQTKGSFTAPIDLSDILTRQEFRQHIADLLGEDLTKELEYLLVEPVYGNLRNRYAHQGLDRSKPLTNVELLAFFRLINAYCLGYDNHSNKGTPRKRNRRFQ